MSLDLGDEDEVARLFEQIASEHGGLDLLVNSAWQWGPTATYLDPTSEQPVERWDAMFGVGIRSLFLAAKHGLDLLAGRKGLLVATQERPGSAEHFADNVVVDAAAVATKRVIEFLAQENRPRSVGAVLVYPGWVRSVNRGMGFDLEAFGWSDLVSNSDTVDDRS